MNLRGYAPYTPYTTSTYVIGPDLVNLESNMMINEVFGLYHRVYEPVNMFQSTSNDF